MFMRYRGSGIGHTYMRAIEQVYENMSRERIHHKVRKRKDAQPNEDAPMGVDGADSAAGDSDKNDDDDDWDRTVDSQAGQDAGPPVSVEDEDEDGEYVPSSDPCSSGVSDSDDLDSDENDGDYEPYGLGDL